MYVKIVCVSLLLICLQHIARLVYLLGYHVTVYNHTPGRCRPVPGVEHGSEDMETLPNGMTFITAGFTWLLSSPNFNKLYNDQGRQGRILLFNFNTPEKGVTELRLDEDFDASTFHPHGISVFQNPETGKITLFVVNHCPEEDKIEKFEFIEDKLMLEHKLSYTDGAVNLVNDVAATSENTFFFTNYGYARSRLGHVFECMLLQLPWGNVVYFDGVNYNEVADGLLIPNGITVSTDKKYVYVATSLFATINIFEREEDNKLSIIQEYHIYSGPDNLLIEPKSGNLLTGAHPVIHQMGAHLDSPDTHRSPSKVLMIHMTNTSHADGVTELYSDDGTSISGSSVASLYDNKMLIGSVLDRLLLCEVKTLD